MISSQLHIKKKSSSGNSCECWGPVELQSSLIPSPIPNLRLKLVASLPHMQLIAIPTLQAEDSLTFWPSFDLEILFIVQELSAAANEWAFPHCRICNSPTLASCMNPSIVHNFWYERATLMNIQAFFAVFLWAFHLMNIFLNLFRKINPNAILTEEVSAPPAFFHCPSGLIMTTYHALRPRRLALLHS